MERVHEAQISARPLQRPHARLRAHFLGILVCYSASPVAQARVGPAREQRLDFMHAVVLVLRRADERRVAVARAQVRIRAVLEEQTDNTD